MIEMIKDKSSIKRELGKFKNKENLGGNQNHDNRFINNFVDQQIINICFKINSQICLSIQANPSDRFKDLFIAAIKKIILIIQIMILTFSNFIMVQKMYQLIL